MGETDCMKSDRLGRRVLLGCRDLIHDGATLFTGELEMILESVRVRSVRLPARSPNLNAFAEQFMRRIKKECLSNRILLR